MKKSQLNGKKTHVVEHSKERREATNFFLKLLVITRTILTIRELLPFFNYLLLTEPEGRIGRILPEVFLVRTERSEVHTRKTEGNILPVRSRASES